MDESDCNPPGNKLASSINEPSLVRAIETSGYPLQGIVADKLNGEFGVTEEWGYIDRDTKEHRCLDIFAFKKLLNEGDVQPRVVLLIECKRSMHPYIFFRSVIEREIPRFPKMAGLTQKSIRLREASGTRVTETSGSAVLGLNELPFVLPGPPHCSAFTKAVPQGDKVSLSGTDPFNTLILPLVKAIDYASELYKAGSDPSCLYPTLILSLSVLDAPILLVNSPAEASTPILTPWIRVSRQEAKPDHNWTRHVYYAVDVVHIDYFDEFMSEHITPFLGELVARAQKQSGVLLKGGSVEDLDNWRWNQITPHL